MTENRSIITETNKILEDQQTALSFYEQVMNISEKITESTTQNTMQQQSSEAKNLILQVIKNQTHDMTRTEEIKKRMVDLYMQIETALAHIEKDQQEVITMKNTLFNELNTRKEISNEIMKTKLQPFVEKIEQIDLSKKSINANLAELKRLSV
jgi:hypothetical protein